MKPHGRRVEELFERVIERSPDEREAFLEEQCGHDHQLRRQVAELLQRYQRLDQTDFLESRPALELAASVAKSAHSSSPGTATSTSLIARIRASDEAGWTQLVELYGPLVYHWCREAAIPSQDRKDLVQQVFSKVLAGIGRFRHGGPDDSFRGWLCTITRNVLVDYGRGQQRGPAARGGTKANQQVQQLPDPVVATSTSSVPAHGDLAKRALDLVRNEFSEPAVRAFELVVLDGYTSAEAGAEVSMSAAAVRQAKSRILRRLREELGEDQG
jgi:RNA polymerase sigma-70 factor (ECF subfamily)